MGHSWPLVFCFDIAIHHHSFGAFLPDLLGKHHLRCVLGVEGRDWGMQGKNSPSVLSVATERQWNLTDSIIRIVLELGTGYSTLVTQVLGWRTLQSRLDCF